MKERLLKILTQRGLTATRFADEIGVQRSGISHILSGRNQPSYDFIVKIMNRYPEINLDWLIMGKGDMHKPKGESVVAVTGNLYDTLPRDSLKNSQVIPENEHKQDQQDIVPEVTNVTSIDRIVIFFSDGTFRPYSPVKD